MGRDEKISLFFRQFTQEQREIIDYISGLIFEHFPLIHEKINNDNLKYISTKFGSLFLIKIINQKVIFYFKKKVNKNSTFKEKQNYYYLEYSTFNNINRKIILDIFNQLL